MKINILTLFPEMFRGFTGESIIKRALEKNLLEKKYQQDDGIEDEE